MDDGPDIQPVWWCTNVEIWLSRSLLLFPDFKWVDDETKKRKISIIRITIDLFLHGLALEEEAL